MYFGEEVTFAHKAPAVILGQELVGIVGQLELERQLEVLQQVEPARWAFPKGLRLCTCLRRI